MPFLEVHEAAFLVDSVAKLKRNLKLVEPHTRRSITSTPLDELEVQRPLSSAIIVTLPLNSRSTVPENGRAQARLNASLLLTRTRYKARRNLGHKAAKSFCTNPI